MTDIMYGLRKLHDERMALRHIGCSAMTAEQYGRVNWIDSYLDRCTDLLRGLDDIRYRYDADHCEALWDDTSSDAELAAAGVESFIVYT